MGRVNTTIELYREERTWDSNIINKFVGEYQGWIEEGGNLTFIHMKTDSIGLSEVGQGTLFLWDDLDLDKCFFLENGKRRDIVQNARFVDGRNRFHHMEVVYK